VDIILKHRNIRKECVVDGCVDLCRWTKELEDLKQQRVRLLGDCLLSSSFLSYVGAFSSEYRTSMVYDMWQKDVLKHEIPLSQPYHLEALLTNDVEVSK